MSTENKTKFWVVCCEETEVTQKVANAVADWQLPGVRSLITNQPAAENIATSEYAIFITSDSQPGSRVKINPLNLVRVPGANTAATSTPAEQLLMMHDQYGQSPQSWWFKLPANEVRAQKVRPVATEKSVAQALSQIEVFVRNYTREVPATGSAGATQKAPATGTTAASTTPSERPQPQKAQPAKRKVVLSHYRRI
ncbi:MAG: hypothetical protein AAGC93_10080 [Cyanobacteria bacterium P01_F01_bin.53]